MASVDSSEKLIKIDSLICLACDKLPIPGLSIGIVSDGEVVFVKGYGFLSHLGSQPVDQQTLFGIGSCTMAFTSFIIGQLVEQGYMHWNDPVVKHIPDFKFNRDNVTRRIKIRDLITHQSGLAPHDHLWKNAKFPRDDLLKRLPHLESNFSFREKYQFNNIMYTIAGIVAERVSGQKWEQLVRDRIFKPAGMTRSNCSIKDIGQSINVAKPHTREGDEIISTPWMDVSLVGPSVSVVSSAEDMVKWLLIQLRKTGQNLMHEETLKEMHINQVALISENSFGYGFGWVLRTIHRRLALLHGGKINGYQANVLLIPDAKIGVVVLINEDSLVAFLDNVVVQIAEILMGHSVSSAEEWVSSAAKAEKQASLLIKSENDTLSHSVENHEQYLGQFENPGYGTIKVLLENGELFAIYNDYRYTLRPKTKFDCFSARRLNQLNEFACFFFRDKQGDVYGCQFNFEPLVPPMLFEKVVPDKFLTDVYLKTFIGNFRCATSSLKIERNTIGMLVVYFDGKKSGEMMIPVNENTFRSEVSTDIFYEFIFSKGKVSELRVHQNEIVYILTPSE